MHLSLWVSHVLNVSPSSISLGHRHYLPDACSACCTGKVEGLRGEGKQLPLQWSCTEGALMSLIRTRDPSGKGLPNALALRLLMLLLHWNPAIRPTPDEVQTSVMLLRYKAQVL